MTEVSLKGILGRKLRVGLTALAIILGVAMVSGTYVLTDTISKAFDQIFVDSTDADAVVSGTEVVKSSPTDNPPISEKLIKKIRKVPGALTVAGQIQASAKVLDGKGKVITTMGSPTFGYGIDFSRPRFNPLKLVKGRWPSSRNEVALDKKTVDDQGFKLGSTVKVAPEGLTKKFKLTGVLKFGKVSSLGGATISAFTLANAQTLYKKEGQVDFIYVAAKKGVSPEKLVRRIRPLLPSSAQVKTGNEQAKANAKEVTDNLAFVRYFLLAFGGIALFVGAFVIFNTISITVAQRTRELATLRTLGATRRQVLLSIMLEALVIGIVSSIIGLFVGLALATGLNAVFSATGIGTPQTGIVFALRTVLVSVPLGILITFFAGVAPALRATSVPPIAAVKEGATLPRSRLAPVAPYAAGGAIVLSLLLLLYGIFAGGLGTTQRLLVLAGSCLLLFTGVALVSTRLVKPLASVIGRPAEWIGQQAGRLARENSTRNPARTAATAAALMIGIALVTFVAVLGQGLRKSVVESTNKQVRAAYVVSPTSTIEPFPIAASRAVAKASAVEVASDVRGDSAKVAGSERTITGVAKATIAKVYRFEFKKGSSRALAGLGKKGAIVTDSFAKEKKLKLGSRFKVVTSDKKTLHFIVRAIYKPPVLGSLLGVASITQNAFDANFPRPHNKNTYIRVKGGEATDAITKALDKKLSPYPAAKLQTKKEFVDAQQAPIKLLLNLLYVLLALSVVVSLFGMVNTMALSIFERTRELGMLRAVGMTRRQVRRMVRYESVITALIGAALGLPLGLFLSLLVTQALKGQGIVFAFPAGALIVFVIVSVIAGVLAAILPARRASRLNVLEALQYE